MATVYRPAGAPSVGANRPYALLLALSSLAVCAVCVGWPEVMNLLGIVMVAVGFSILKPS